MWLEMQAKTEIVGGGEENAVIVFLSYNSNPKFMTGSLAMDDSFLDSYFS